MTLRKSLNKLESLQSEIPGNLAIYFNAVPDRSKPLPVPYTLEQLIWWHRQQELYATDNWN